MRSFHQSPDSASVSVCTSAGVGQDVSLLCEQCGPILLCVWGSDVSVKEAFYNASDQESPPSVLLNVKWVTMTRSGRRTLCAIRLGGCINRKEMTMPFAAPLV
jgi:hypothetical protein